MWRLRGNIITFEIYTCQLLAKKFSCFVFRAKFRAGHFWKQSSLKFALVAKFFLG
uniref:Uncharacterized protein n=1 Tax=Tetranychus urticae TaxID=32264 RepID=T1KRD0_TETUR